MTLILIFTYNAVQTIWPIIVFVMFVIFIYFFK